MIEELVHEHIGWMFAVAQRVLKDETMAEDAVQNAFTKVFEKQGTFEGRSSLKTWMHRILVNEALTLLRKRETRKELVVDHAAPAFDQYGLRIEDPRPPTLTPEEHLQSAQTRNIVRHHIDDLPESYRVAIILRDIEGLSIREMSSKLELSETNTKVRLHRARCALKKRLAPYAVGLMK
ncbi:RNA polymerase sigma factor [Litoreibacter albidus]|uniref:RNA polymerase sigma factor n=1 Tax=Litoreibacter albidus TaxID=670155 RepID=UPI003736D322